MSVGTAERALWGSEYAGSLRQGWASKVGQAWAWERGRGGGDVDVTRAGEQRTCTVQMAAQAYMNGAVAAPPAPARRE